MTCKNCGADVGIEYRLCPYCRTELDYPERERPVIINNYYTQNPAAPRPQPMQQPVQNNNPYRMNWNPAVNEMRAQIDKAATSALIFSILGLLLGLFILRIIFACIALSNAKKATQLSNEYRLPLPASVKAANVIAIISMILGILIFAFTLISCFRVTNQ
jgi:hypothetical protein